MSGGAPRPSTAALVAFAGVAAACVGGVSFLAGFIGPILLTPDSNLGPLLGVFVTGPMGAMVGALIGILLWARRAGGAGTARAASAAAGVWIVSLLLTQWLSERAGWAALLGVALQAAVIGAVARLRWSRRSRAGRTARASAGVSAFLVVAAAVLLSTLFPPVTRPSWGEGLSDASGPLPLVAFILSSGFDARYHVPRYEIATPVLLLEWLSIAAVGLGVGLIRLRSVARSSPSGHTEAG